MPPSGSASTRRAGPGPTSASWRRATSGPDDPVEVIHRPEHGLTIAGLYQRVGHPTPEGLQQIVATPDVPENVRAWAARQIRR